MMTSSDFIIECKTQNGLISRLRLVQNGLLKGLLSIRLIDGWADTYLDETSNSTWTSTVVLKSLLQHRIITDNYLATIKGILEKKKQSNNFIGWELEWRFPSFISTHVTSDVLLLMLSLHKFTEAEPIIQSLQNMQNKKGGWGVCLGDTISKVDSTVFVLNALLEALAHPATSKFIRTEEIEKAINWLYDAQNENCEDYGWGLLPNTLPSGVSSTAWAIYVLLKAMEVNKQLKVRKESLRFGINTLKGMGKDGFWKGDVEDFGITVDEKFIGRHTVVGPGTTLVIRVLIKAINNGILPPNDRELFCGIENLLLRSKIYSGKEGFWIIPSENGGMPLIWNSAYALDAIYDIQQFYLMVIEGSYVDKNVYEKIESKVKIWKRLTIALLVAITGVFLIVSFKSLLPISDSFTKLPSLLQGLILVGVTLLAEELYGHFKSYYSKYVKSELSKLLKRI